MTCKTGCGESAPTGFVVCDPCSTRWQQSPERARTAYFDDVGEARKGDVAFVDFCDRIRAERLNGGKS